MKKAKERIEVIQRVSVRLPAEELRHVLRCWVAHELVQSNIAPPPKSFSDIVVTVYTDQDGALLEAQVTYEPAA
jgi:hypothetical protein